MKFVTVWHHRAAYKSLPVRGAWIEIKLESLPDLFPKSLPVRGAWIEIPKLVISADIN